VATDGTSGSGRGERGRKAAVGFILVSVWLDVLSLGVIIPVFAPLIQHQFTGGDAAVAAGWIGIFSTVWALAQFVGSPILGALSDRFGRRPVLLISLFGLGVDFLFMAFAPTLWWLYLGRVLNGMTAASFSTANAYLADVTRPEERAKVFGWMSSAFSFGFIFGPAIGGFLGDENLRIPFFAAAAITLINWLYGFFILPESLPPERRTQAFDWRRANPLGSLILLRSRPGLLGLAGVGFLFQLAHVVLPSIFVLYVGYRYNWTPKIMGVTFLATGVAGVIVQSFLVGPIVKWIGERNAVLLGALAGLLGFAWYGSAPTGTVYLLAVPVFAFTGLLMPGLQGLMTRRVGPQQQGQLQGANQSLMGLSSIIGPMVFGEVFAWSLRNEAFHMPGLAIYLAAGLMGLAFLLALGTARAAAPEPQPA
jgi:DHA1 family tetracycline resistance protein-like MFS transporter